jgi:hypothetical protein
MKKSIKCLLAGLALAGMTTASADNLCERISDNYQKTGQWVRDCGPEPGKPYVDELKKDCLQTVRQIQARPGASWNSEHGWAADYQCDALTK